MTDCVFWMSLFMTEASERRRDWNISRYGLSPVLATEAQHSGLFFFFSMGAATTVGLSWLHTSQNYLGWKFKVWITLIVTQLPALAAKILWLQQFDYKIDCVSHFLLLKRCLVLQLDIKPKRQDLRVTAHWSTWVPRCNEGQRVCAVKLLWCSVEKSAEP